jgi:DNA-binding LytR/AlgR family response regulator
MMKCIIIDDEPLAREGMELNIHEVDDLELVGQFPSATAANNFLIKNEIDLMFLDIQMPGITGLEFLKSMAVKPLTIMTTAYPEFALQGFELDVVDYLVKPVRLQRFVQAVNKARELHNARKNTQTTQETEYTLDDYIYLKSDRKLVKVRLGDILYIEGMKDYVTVKTKDASILTAMNMKTINQQLDETFFVRVSKSYIINATCIDEVNQNIVVVGGKEIPLGKTYKDHFIDTYIKDKVLERK